MRLSRGFTLVELVITMVVLAILMVMAGPALADFMQRYRLKGAADDVATILASARAEALARNRDVSVVFENGDSGWCVGASAVPEPETPGEAVDGAADCDCSAPAEGDECAIGDRALVTVSDRHGGVTAVDLPDTLTFNRQTGAINDFEVQAATLESANGRYQLSVRVTPLGRGELCVAEDSEPMTGFEAC